jgi:hypothetical protein
LPSLTVENRIFAINLPICSKNICQIEFKGYKNEALSSIFSCIIREAASMISQRSSVVICLGAANISVFVISFLGILQS